MSTDTTPSHASIPEQEHPEGEWISMKAAADLIDVPYNDVVSAVHHYHILESRKDGSNRLVQRAQVLEKAEELRNLPIRRRPNRRMRGRRPGATR